MNWEMPLIRHPRLATVYRFKPKSDTWLRQAHSIQLDLASMQSPLVLTRFVQSNQVSRDELTLALTAEQRSVLRGLRSTTCGQDVLLQLPRDGVLKPGDCLAGETLQPLIRVVATAEPLLRVQATTTLELVQAAYHLGNRHIALEVRDAELLLLKDSVLEMMLRRRGLQVTSCDQPFHPEVGAYSSHDHS